jgi:hypothetical protein
MQGAPKPAVVRFAELGDSRLMTRALGTYRKSLVAAPAYLAAKGVPLIPDDLKAHACLHHPWYGPVCPVVGEGWHREVSPYPNHRRSADLERIPPQRRLRADSGHSRERNQTAGIRPLWPPRVSGSGVSRS